jgi:hypothetical protein
VTKYATGNDSGRGGVMGYKDVIYVCILLASLTGLHLWHEADKAETRFYRDEMDRRWMEYIEKLENENYLLINGHNAKTAGEGK